MLAEGRNAQRQGNLAQGSGEPLSTTLSHLLTADVRLPVSDPAQQRDDRLRVVVPRLHLQT